MEIIKVVIMVVGMFAAAGIIRARSAFLTDLIENDVLNRLAKALIWALSASVVGTVICLLLSVTTEPPFFTWLIAFTFIDFAAGYMRKS